MSTDKNLTELEKDTLAAIVAFKVDIAYLFESVNEIRRALQRLDEVYYHVFPDRRGTDARFEGQLLSLNLPREPDTPAKPG